MVHRGPADSPDEMIIEFKICEAGGVSIVLKSQKEVCNKQPPEQTGEDNICGHGP